MATGHKKSKKDEQVKSSADSKYEARGISFIVKELVPTLSEGLSKRLKPVTGPSMAANRHRIADLVAELKENIESAPGEKQIIDTTSTIESVYHHSEQAAKNGIILQAGDARLRLSPMELKWLYGEVKPSPKAPQAAGDVESISGPLLQLQPNSITPFKWLQERRQLEIMLGKESVDILPKEQIDKWRSILNKLRDEYQKQDYNMDSEGIELRFMEEQGTTPLVLSPDFLTHLFGNSLLTNSSPIQGFYFINLGGAWFGDPQGTRRDFISVFTGDFIGNIYEHDVTSRNWRNVGRLEGKLDRNLTRRTKSFKEYMDREVKENLERINDEKRYRKKHSNELLREQQQSSSSGPDETTVPKP